MGEEIVVFLSAREIERGREGERKIKRERGSETEIKREGNCSGSSGLFL